MIGFTTDQTGANLPCNFGPWMAMGSQAMPSGAPKTDAVLATLREVGFFVARSRTPASEYGSPEPKITECHAPQARH